MKLVETKCNNCHADLELDLENLQAFCPYCGHKLVFDFDVDKLIAEREKTKRAQDKLKESTRQKEMDIKYAEKKDRREARSRSMKIILAGMLIIAMIGIGAYFHISHINKEKALEANGYIRIPLSSSEIESGDYSAEDLHTAFLRNGFTNVRLEKIQDIKIGVLKKDGELEKVTVNGQTSFNKDKLMPSDTEIVISYHTKKDKKPKKNVFQLQSEEEDYYCPNCEANLNKQKIGKHKFDPEQGAWICTECGQPLYDEKIESTMELYEGIIWVCDDCEAILNSQHGFRDSCGTWVCTECGHKNTISEEAIQE